MIICLNLRLGVELQLVLDCSLTAVARGDCKIPYSCPQKTDMLSPLDRIGWLAEAPEDFKCWVAETGRWRLVRAGQFIYHAGDPSNGIYGVGAGGIQITFPLLAEEPVVIHRGEIGLWFGDGAELANVPRVISVSAATESRIFHLPGTAIATFLDQHPKHWRSFYRLSTMNMRLGSGLIDQSQNATAAAMQMAEKKVWAHRS